MTLSFEKKLYFKLGDFIGKHLLVAFSGGKDSAALLHFLKKNEGIKGYTVSACHINHMFRKTAGWDEKFCADFCERMGIPYLSYKCDVPLYCKVKKISFEHGARVVRYRALRKAMNELRADTLLTAHNKNDVVETFFVHAVQGASVFSLKGVSKHEGDLIRPMLDISVEEIIEYLQKYKIEHVHDESNNDESFMRNFIRKNITPALAEYREGFEDNILNIVNDAVRFDRYISEKTVHLIKEGDSGEFVIDRRKFESLHEIEQEYLIHKAGARLFRFERRHLDEILKTIDSEFSSRIDLPDGYKFEKSDNYLRFIHSRMIAPFEVLKPKGVEKIYIKQINKEIFFDKRYINKELIVRNRRVGDRLGNKKIKDSFIDKKLDLFERDISLIITEKDSIVWVENISHDDSISISVNRKKRS
jgi:tRNA(Ile)-lysidine synthase